MPETDMADERKKEISLDPQSTENINFNQSMDENDMNFNQMNFSEVKELPLEWLDRLTPYTEPMKSMTWRQQFSRVFFVDDHGVLRPFDLERAQAGEMSHFQQLSGLPYNVGEILQQFTSLPLSLIYHYTGMGLYMRALFDSQRLVDTLIHVEDRVFAAHRVVLACHSTYFAQVFLSSKHPSPKMAELRVKNIDPNMFYIVLSFLYTGQLYVNQNNVDHLLNVAHQLHVPAVLFKCLDFLDHILPNKTIDMVTEPKAVVDEAYRLMEAPLREIIHTTTFLTTSIEALEVALGQDDLPVSAESEVFSAALQWLQFDLESREKYLERLMQQVRFAYMRPGEVIQAAQSSPLLKSSAYCRNRIMEAIWLMTLRGYQADDFLECGSCKPRNYLDSDEGVPQDYDNWGHARYDNLLEPAVSQPFQKQPSLTRQPSLRRNSSQSLASARQMQRRRSSHSVETARQTKRRRSSNIMPLAQLSAKSLQQPASLPSVSQQPSTRSSHTLPVYQPLPSTLLQKQPSYLQPSQLHTDLSLGGQSESADYSFPEKALMSPRSSTIAAREIPSMKLLQRQNSNVQTSSQQSSSNGSLPRRVASLRQTSSGVLPQESNSYSLLQEKLSSISRQNCSGALGHPQASFNEETQQLGQPLVPLYQRESSSALVHKKASERMLQKQPSMTQPPQQPSTVSVQRQPSYHAPLPQQQMPREVPQVAGPSAPPVIEIISPPSSIRSITKHLSKTQPSEQQIASKNSHLRGTQSTGILLKKDHSYTGVSLKQTQSGTVPQTSLKQASAGGLQQKEPSFVSLQQKEPSFVSLQQKEPSFVSLQQKSSSVFPQQRAVQPPTAPQLHPLHPPLVKLVAERKHWDAPSVSFQQPASLPPRSPPRTPPSQQPSPRPRQKEPPPRPLKREPSVTQHREPSPRPLKREPSVTQHREPSPRPLKREPSVTQHREPSPRPLKREPSVTQHREPSPRPLKREPSVTQHREPSPRPLKREPSVTQPREPSPRPLKREPSVTQHREPSPRPLKREPSVTQHREPSPRPLKREPSVTQHREPSPRPLKREPSVTQHREPSPRPLNREPSVTQHREPSPRPLKREPSIEQRREPSSTAPQSGPLPHSPVPEAPAPPSPTEEASDVEMPFFRVCRSRFLDEEVQGRVIEVEVGFSRSNHSATARTDRRHRSRSRSKERHPADGYGTGDESDAFPAGLLAIGGFVEDGDPTGKCHSHMLDAGDQKWLKMSEMPQTRLHFAAAFVREKLYVTGGYDPSIFADETESHATKTTFQYSPRKERWRRVADMRSARAFHTVSVLSGRLYALGGQDEHEEVLKSAEVYNPAEDRWAPLPPMMDGRVGAASAPLTLSLSGEGEGEVMVVGGYGEGGEGDPTDIPCCPVLMSTEIFDPDTERYDPYEDQWTNVTNLTIARHNAGAAAFDGKLYVVGGVTTYVEGVLRSVECYDMDTGKWDSSLPLLPLGAKSVACVTIAKDI